MLRPLAWDEDNSRRMFVYTALFYHAQTSQLETNSCPQSVVPVGQRLDVVPRVST